MERRLRGTFETGWLVADLMFKLGILGTVIGFILMLSAVPDGSSMDIDTTRAALIGMSEGMRIALHTTLTGLVCGMLLTMQYHLADRSADELIACLTELIELHVMPLTVHDDA